MSLSRKFAILLGLLALTIVVSLGAAAWSFHLLQREVASPFVDLARTLGTLSALKSELAAPGDETSPEKLESLLTELRDSSATLGLVGVSTSRNLTARIEAAIQARRTGRASDRAETEEAAARLIERVETQVASNAAITFEHVAALRRNLTFAMALSLLGACLVAALGYLLMDRWIVRPVAALREAAQRIGSGDFDHRVPVTGRDEIARLSAEVNKMAAMVAELHEERVQRERLAAAGQMLRRLVHNLRNPLAGIRSLAELSEADAPKDSELRDNQSRIVATVDRFEKWLADLLHRTSPISVSFESQRVASWIVGVAETHRASAAARSIDLELAMDQAPDRADFDAGHLEQAISVAISNAIEASPRGARVQIEALAAAEADSWRIRITDQGPGVPPDLRQRIFEPQFTTKRGGVGIGLAFAKQVVAAHGGRISVDDAAGGGAVFEFELPLAIGGRSESPAGEMQPA